MRVHLTRPLLFTLVSESKRRDWVLICLSLFFHFSLQRISNSSQLQRKAWELRRDLGKQLRSSRKNWKPWGNDIIRNEFWFRSSSVLLLKSLSRENSKFILLTTTTYYAHSTHHAIPFSVLHWSLPIASRFHDLSGPQCVYLLTRTFFVRKKISEGAVDWCLYSLK